MASNFEITKPPVRVGIFGASNTIAYHWDVTFATKPSGIIDVVSVFQDPPDPAAVAKLIGPLADQLEALMNL